MFLNIVGYGSSGSSAVVDLLREIKGVHVAEGETRFIQDTDGLEDLCYNLVHRWGWHRCDAVVKRFIRYTDILARPAPRFGHGENLNEYFNGDFLRLRNEFIEKIITVKFMGHHPWSAINERKWWEVTWERLAKILYFKYFGTEKSLRDATIKKVTFFVDPTKDIYCHAQDFIENLYTPFIVNVPDPIVVLDHGIQAYNLIQHRKLFRNSKTIIVNRDPRDAYLDSLTYNAYPITKNIQDFIDFYFIQHNYDYNEFADVLRINFEDLILNYDSLTSGILNFLNIDKSRWSKRKHFFDPNASKKNILLFKKEEHHRYIHDISRIEESLKTFLYSFNNKNI